MNPPENADQWRLILEKSAQIMIPRYEKNEKYSSPRLFRLQKPHLDRFLEAAQSPTGRTVLRELLESDDYCSRYWSAYGLMEYGETSDRPLATKTLDDMIAMPRRALSPMQTEMCFYAFAALSVYDFNAALAAAQRRPGRAVRTVSLPPGN